MKSEILVIAEAILANTQVLKMLIDKLPPGDQVKIAGHIEVLAPVASVPMPAAPVAEVKKPEPTPAPSPVVTPAPIPVAVAPTPTINLVPMPAAPAPVTVSPSDCPIKDGKSLMETMMALYKELGPQKGAAIQGVLKSVGCEAVNEVRPDQYAAIWAGLQALKVA